MVHSQIFAKILSIIEFQLDNLVSAYIELLRYLNIAKSINQTRSIGNIHVPLYPSGPSHINMLLRSSVKVSPIPVVA